MNSYKKVASASRGGRSKQLHHGGQLHRVLGKIAVCGN